MSRTSSFVTAFCLLASIAHAEKKDNVFELSLEDLLNVKITTVAHKQQEAGKTPAAVYVITQEDIRRLGVHTLPDLLRTVPGFTVSQLNASTWSVASRGFAGILSNKLLVLIDGRSVYSVTTGVMNWELQLLPLDTIQQIEVVRGPGGSLWGANAINGVINIITKSADQSRGGYAAVQSGTIAPNTISFGYGGALGVKGSWSTQAQYLERRTPDMPANADAVDAFYARTRFDWRRGDGHRFSVIADAQQGDQTIVSPAPMLQPPFTFTMRDDNLFTSGSVAFSWNIASSSRVESDIRAYYSGQSRQSQRAGDLWHVEDVELRQRRALGDHHELVMGAEYRHSWVSATNTPFLTVVPAEQHRHLVTAFAQDEYSLSSRLSVFPGVKLERNEDTGVEVQPSVRTIWQVTPQHTAWAAASRGVRTPNRFDIGLHIPTVVIPAEPLPIVPMLVGNPAFRSESQRAFELGYRVHRGPFAADVTTFVSDYDHLLGWSEAAPVVGRELGGTVIRVPVVLNNDNEALSRGVEVSATVRATDWWRVSTSYASLNVEFRDGAGNVQVEEGPLHGSVPRHNWHTRSYVSLPRSVDLTASFARVSALPYAGVESYQRLDTRVGWTLRRQLELAAGVNNLLRDEVPEYRDRLSFVQEAPVRREAYGQIGWRF